MKHIIYITRVTFTETPYGYKTIKIEPSFVEKREDSKKLVHVKDGLGLAESIDIPDTYNSRTAVILDVIRQLKELGIMEPQDHVVTYDGGDQTGAEWKDEASATVFSVKSEQKPAVEAPKAVKRICLDKCRACCKHGGQLCYEGPYECQLEQIETLEKYGVYPECSEYLDEADQHISAQEWEAYQQEIADYEREQEEEEERERDRIETEYRLEQEEKERRIRDEVEAEWIRDQRLTPETTNPYED